MNNHTKWHTSHFLPEVYSSILTAVAGQCLSNHMTERSSELLMV